MSTVPDHIYRVAGLVPVNLEPQIKRAESYTSQLISDCKRLLIESGEDGPYMRTLAGALARESLDLQHALEWECIAGILQTLDSQKGMNVCRAGSYLLHSRLLAGPKPIGFSPLEEPEIIDEGKTAVLDAIAEAGTHATMRQLARELRPQQLSTACTEIHNNLLHILNQYVSGTIPRFA